MLSVHRFFIISASLGLLSLPVIAVVLVYSVFIRSVEEPELEPPPRPLSAQPPTGAATPGPTVERTPEPTATVMPTPTAAATPTLTPEPELSPTPEATTTLTPTPPPTPVHPVTAAPVPAPTLTAPTLTMIAPTPIVPVIPAPTPTNPTPEPTPTPMPMPEATPVPEPTATALPPMPTPTATPAPKPELPNGYANLQGAQYLEDTNSAIAQRIRALPWVADGVTTAERDAAEALLDIATFRASLFLEVAEKTWLEAGSVAELDATLPALASILRANTPGFQEIIAMPFLDTLSEPDLTALESLSGLAAADLDAFRRVMANETVKDGISNREARIVSLLYGVNQTNPDLVETLLDPTETSLRERIIELPQAGQVTLTIIRIKAGAERSMDLLEHSVRTAEALVGEPFPTKHVTLLFGDAVGDSADGAYFGTHIAALPKYDVHGSSAEAEAAGGVIAHQVGRYYWNGSADWLDEGAAGFTAAVAEQSRVDRPLEPYNYPCVQFTNLQELESANPTRGTASFRCNYSLGERLFLDLHRGLGDHAFREGLRLLYLRAVARGDNPAAPGSIGEVAEAFKSVPHYSGAVVENIVQHVIDRWYDGSKPYDTQRMDSQPVDAELSRINGEIEEAYITLPGRSSPVDKLSTEAQDAWIMLNLEYSQDYSGGLRRIELEVVEYFEDGFPYRRADYTLRVNSRSSGDTIKYRVGPGPGRAFAPGRHWIYVYHRGHKAAEVVYEVTR